MRKKVVSPESRRAVVLRVASLKICSKRRACRFIRLPRSSFYYRSLSPSAEHNRLLERMRFLSQKHDRYGYRRIAALLRREGFNVGKRQIQKLRRAEGLRVPETRKKTVRRGISTGLPTKASHRGHVWTWDFIADFTQRGGSVKILTILDEYTKECHVLRPERMIKSGDVLEWLQKAIGKNGAPKYLRSDNGSEFIANIVQDYFENHGIKTIYIDPGSPWQNGFVESFHSRFRDECLNRELLWTLTETQVVVETWRCEYNERRPHSRLGFISPAQFVASLN
ncbi:MAG: IS3 family transposase [Spirochaetia bacterium]|nr:IS3 family transposase [Spirochaetia bacterium]